MRIKMKTMMAGPDGCRNVGDVVEVDDREGNALVSGNYAEAVTPKRFVDITRIGHETEFIEVPEAATTPSPETATAPVQRAKRGRK